MEQNQLCMGCRQSSDDSSVLQQSQILCTSDLCICLHCSNHFPGGPGLAGTGMSPFWILSEQRMMRWWWQLELQDVQSSSHIITTNKTNAQLFYRLDALPVTQSTVSEHWMRSDPVSQKPRLSGIAVYRPGCEYSMIDARALWRCRIQPAEHRGSLHSSDEHRVFRHCSAAEITGGRLVAPFGASSRSTPMVR